MQRVRSGDGTEIAVERSGHGPALVLIGGAFQDRTSMRMLAAGLADAFTVYGYDRRGRGDSGDVRPYAIEREVEDLEAVIDAAGEAAAVFGQSSGGALALEAAARDVPIRAVVVNEPPYIEGSTVRFAAHLRQLVAEGDPEGATMAFLGLAGRSKAQIAQLRASGVWRRMQAFAPTLCYEVWLCNDGRLPVDRLARISVPALALAGAASSEWAPAVARAIARRVPRATTRVLAGQGHIIADDILIPELKGFLKG